MKEGLQSRSPSSLLVRLVSLPFLSNKFQKNKNNNPQLLLLLQTHPSLFLSLKPNTLPEIFLERESAGTQTNRLLPKPTPPTFPLRSSKNGSLLVSRFRVWIAETRQMAGWSVLENGSTLDYLEILQILQKNGFCVDLDLEALRGSSEGGKDGRAKDAFDRIVSGFLSECCVSGSVWPLPATLGDGSVVDLFRLFCVVRERGGFDPVSRSTQWGLVAEEIGLGAKVGTSVKLFYFKYLDLLDRYVRSLLRSKSNGGVAEVGQCDKNLESLVGLKTQTMSSDSYQSGVNVENRELDFGKNDGKVLLSQDGQTKHKAKGEADGVEKAVAENGENVTSVKKGVIKGVYSRKRKRETLPEMLNWVLDIAKNPSDTAFRNLAEAYKQKENGGKGLHGLVLSAREAMLIKRKNDWSQENENPLWQKKQKMHPSMYEDQMAVDNLFTERVKGSPGISPRKNGQLDPNHGAAKLDVTAPLSAEVEDYQSLDPFDDGESRKHVSIGPLSQAEVPEWTGVALESDPKWLGTQNWPLTTEEQHGDRYHIGKGRQDSCHCRAPGTVGCVRFHIAEEKVRLKFELGVAFYTWRFQSMGEEVSLSWTIEEEDKFKDTVRAYPPSQPKNFWKQLRKLFRGKGWKNLVNYYFNVFVLRRRMYQNRFTPSDIDSDDDESEFGSVGDGFGFEAVKVPGFMLLPCTQNYQCIDLD